RSSQFSLAPEHECSGGADVDAVAAIDTGRFRQRHSVLGRDPGVKPAPRDGDGKGILSVYSAGFHALVTEDAFAVVANIKLIIDLDRLRHRGCHCPLREDMETWKSRITPACRSGGSRWAEAFWPPLVALHVILEFRCRGDIH